MTISDVENLFVEKFTEKHSLSERDLGRAFKKYDLNGSGFLDLNEFAKAVHNYVPGLKLDLGNKLASWRAFAFFLRLHHLMAVEVVTHIVSALICWFS
jgi:EF hand